MAKKKYKNSSSNGSLKKFILILTILVLAGFVYWQFFRTPNTASKTKAIQGYTAFDFVKLLIQRTINFFQKSILKLPMTNKSRQRD